MKNQNDHHHCLSPNQSIPNERRKYFVNHETYIRPYGESKDKGQTVYYIEKFITKLWRSRTGHIRPAIV